MKHFFKILFFLPSFLFFAYTSYAQTKAQKNKQELGLATYNIAFGGITAGLGAIINKKKGEKTSKVFLTGLKYGCFGGAVNYCAKRLDHFIYRPSINMSTSNTNEKYFLWGWPTKIVHSIGTSIINNAALNKKNVFKNYNIPIGFINLNVNFKNRLHINPQLMPITASTFFYFIVNKNFKFQAKQSLLLGTPLFLYSSNIANTNFQYYAGRTIENIITVNDNTYAPTYTIYSLTLAHETIHTLQVNEYEVFNSFFKKPFDNLAKNKNSVIKKLSKFIYPEITYQGLFYYIMSHTYSTSNPPTGNDYYKNFFELEAQHFAENDYIAH